MGVHLHLGVVCRREPVPEGATRTLCRGQGEYWRLKSTAEGRRLFTDHLRSVTNPRVIVFFFTLLLLFFLYLLFAPFRVFVLFFIFLLLLFFLYLPFIFFTLYLLSSRSFCSCSSGSLHSSFSSSLFSIFLFVLLFLFFSLLYLISCCSLFLFFVCRTSICVPVLFFSRLFLFPRLFHCSSYFSQQHSKKIFVKGIKKMKRQAVGRE